MCNTHYYSSKEEENYYAMSKGRIVILGFGNMGRALARGLRKESKFKKMKPFELIACVRNEDSSSHSPLPEREQKGITILRETEIPQYKAHYQLGSKDTIILCIKPQNFLAAAESWKSVFLCGDSQPLVISILAGMPMALIQKYFAGDRPVIRAMPNIAATVDAAATAFCVNRLVSQEHIERARFIFDSVGRSWQVPEDLIDAVTGLSGSGPAYLYMVIEALSDGGVKMGMPRALALELAAQTVLGAARLVQVTKEHPAVLRDLVTTPGGTTISAIHELERHGLRHMLISAVVTATERSAALADVVEHKILKSKQEEKTSE